jgi:hypothetical protein
MSITNSYKIRRKKEENVWKTKEKKLEKKKIGC